MAPDASIQNLCRYFMVIWDQHKYYTLKPWCTETLPQRSCNLVGGKRTSSDLRENNRGCLNSPSSCGQNPKGEGDAFAFQSLTTTVHGTALCREERFIFIIEQGLENNIRSPTQNLVTPETTKMCPVACSMHFTFCTFPRHKRAAMALSPPKFYAPGIDPAKVSIQPHHSWQWDQICPLTSQDCRVCFSVYWVFLVPNTIDLQQMIFKLFIIVLPGFLLLLLQNYYWNC